MMVQVMKILSLSIISLKLIPRTNRDFLGLVFPSRLSVRLSLGFLPSFSDFRSPESVAAYVDRFNVARKPLEMKKGQKFNVDTFSRKEVNYRELHGFSNLKQVGQTYDGLNRSSDAATSQTGVSIAQVLSTADYFFFVDPQNPFDGGFSVHSKSAQQVALNRGFREMNFSHLSAIEQIPHPRKASAVQIIDQPTPLNLSLPQGKLPNLFRLADESPTPCRSFAPSNENLSTPTQIFRTLPADFGRQRQES